VWKPAFLSLKGTWHMLHSAAASRLHGPVTLLRVCGMAPTTLRAMIAPIIHRIHPLRCHACGSTLIGERGVYLIEDKALYRQRCGGCGAMQEASLDRHDVLGDRCPVCASTTLTFMDGVVATDGWRLQHTCPTCGTSISNCSERQCGQCRSSCLRKGPARECSTAMAFEMEEICVG
jgi:hypothetical protein